MPVRINALALVLTLMLGVSVAGGDRPELKPRHDIVGAPNPVAAIFMYHHVSGAVQPGPYARALTVQPQEFAGQLSWLRSHGCETVSVDTIVADVLAGALRNCEVALTFDDGYSDVDAVAQPILEQAGDTATLYLTSGLVGSPGHIGKAEVRKLAYDGFQIGAHTVNHVDLTVLADRRARAEIADSRNALEQWSTARVDSFAYPAGRHDARVESLVRAAGFRNALATTPGLLSGRAGADQYALPRFRVERDTGTALMKAVVGPALRARRSPYELRRVARERVEGNDAALAERIGAALLNASYPEQLLKVRVLRADEATVVGLMLSGVKLHAQVSRAQFEADAGGMIERTFDARPDVTEVDVWAVAPLEVQPRGGVSGEYAAPTTRTVFSTAVTRRARETAATRNQMLGTLYWENGFLTGASAR